MKEQLYFWMDLTEYMVFGAMLSYLMKDVLTVRFGRTRKLPFGIMCLQYAAVRIAFSYFVPLKKLLYGEALYIADSRQSIVPVAASMAVTLFAGILLYQRNHMRLLSLVTVFYALHELIRFAVYPLAVGSMGRISEYYSRMFFEEGPIDVKRYRQLIERTEILWNMLLFLAIGGLLFFCIRRYRQYFLCKSIYRFYGETLLFLPALLGLMITAMLRSILFYYDTEVYNLIERYAELNLMIPLLSLLCTASILLSVKMLGEMEKEHEKRRQAELYQSRMEELEAHVLDMESVNIQIRGMKHDMKHYIADVNALLAQAFYGDDAAKEEARRYVDSMQASLEHLDLKYQTKHPVTDIILGRYFRIAAQRNIAFSSDFIFPHHLGIDAFDISVILNNGLDNAFEACETAAEQPCVFLTAKQKGNMLLLTIENTSSAALVWENGLPVSEKPGIGHGFGLKNIQRCAEKYYGTVKAYQAENRFYLTVMLQGRRDFVAENH